MIKWQGPDLQSIADVAGLYRGGCITLLRDIPAHAIYFTTYELCHELFEPGSRLTGVHSPAALFMSGERQQSLRFEVSASDSHAMQP